MNNLRGSKRPVESILVAKDDAALVAGGTALSAANGDVNIADGQLAIMADSGEGTVTLNTAISAGDTVVDAPQIRIYQGTENSNNIPASRDYPIAKRPYEVSGPILGDQITVFTGKVFEEGTRSIVTIGTPTGTGSGEIAATDETVYALNVALRGRRVDEFHSSVHGVPAQTFEYTTPDYSALGLANDEDHLIQNLCWKINRNSREFSFDSPSFGANWPVVALAVDASGGAGVLLNSAVGTFLPVISTAAGNRGITIDDELFASFAALIASGDVPATATVELIDLSTAGSAAADQIVLVALNENTAVVDRNPYVKIKLNVGAEGGFEDALVVASESVPAYEGQGSYRQWKIYYDNTAGQRKYSQYQGFDVLNVEYPDSLVPGENYNAYIIEHYTAHNLQFAGVSNSPQKTIILVPTGDSTTKASLEAVLNPYMASVGKSPVTL